MDLERVPEEGRKITVTLPDHLIQRLDKHIEPHQINQFVQLAIEERLTFEEEFNAVEESVQAWLQDEENSPSPEEDVYEWLRDVRSTWEQQPSL